MPKTKKIYAAFGLIIKSEIDLPGLIPATGHADVEIVYGEAPAGLETPLAMTPWFQIADGQFLLKVDGVARYYAENGNRIVIEPFQDAENEDVRVFLLNSVLAALLHQRDYLVLHGSAVIVDGKAVAIVGASQTGKTAIALNFYDRGHVLLSDEIAAIKIQNDRAVIFPGIPQLNVWHDTLQLAGKDLESYLPVRKGLNKYIFPVYEQFGAEGISLENLVFLKHHNQTEITKELIQGGSRFRQLMQHAYVLGAVSDKVQHFKICAKIIEQAFFCQLTFHERPYRIDQIADLIIKELHE